MKQFDRYLKVLWEEYKLPGVLIVVAVIAGLMWLWGFNPVDAAKTYVNWNSFAHILWARL